jgi:hypothetical protein
LIEGKAQEFQVRPSDLFSPNELLSGVFAEVFDSDLVTGEQRTSVESRITAAVSALEGRDDLSAVEEAAQAADRTQRWLAALGASTAVVGTAAALIPELLKGGLTGFRFVWPAIAVLVGGLAVNTAIAALRRIKDSTESSAPQIQSFSPRWDKLELDIAKVLEKAGVRYQAQVALPDDGTADFILELGGKKTVIEAKAWNRVPLALIVRTIDRVRLIRDKAQAEQGVIVVYDAKWIPTPLRQRDIKVMSLADFATRLKSGQS